MTKNFVFNMGYDTSHVLSVISSEGLEDGSRILLVTPPERDERQENAIGDIKNYLGSISLESSLEVVDTGKMSGSFSRKVQGLQELFDKEGSVILSLSGGPRDFLIPMCIAAVLSPKSIEKTYMRSDLDASLEEINLPAVGFSLDDGKAKLLGILEQKDMTASQLSSHVDDSVSTIYRKLRSLEEEGFVNWVKDAGEKRYSITCLGEAALRQNG